MAKQKECKKVTPTVRKAGKTLSDDNASARKKTEASKTLTRHKNANHWYCLYSNYKLKKEVLGISNN